MVHRLARLDRGRARPPSRTPRPKSAIGPIVDHGNPPGAGGTEGRRRVSAPVERFMTPHQLHPGRFSNQRRILRASFCRAGATSADATEVGKVDATVAQRVDHSLANTRACAKPIPVLSRDSPPGNHHRSSIISQGEHTSPSRWPVDPRSGKPRAPASERSANDGRTRPLRPSHRRLLPSRGPEPLELPLKASEIGPTRSSGHVRRAAPAPGPSTDPALRSAFLPVSGVGVPESLAEVVLPAIGEPG